MVVTLIDLSVEQLEAMVNDEEHTLEVQGWDIAFENATHLNLPHEDKGIDESNAWEDSDDDP